MQRSTLRQFSITCLCTLGALIKTPKKSLPLQHMYSAARLDDEAMMYCGAERYTPEHDRPYSMPLLLQLF